MSKRFLSFKYLKTGAQAEKLRAIPTTTMLLQVNIQSFFIKYLPLK